MLGRLLASVIWKFVPPERPPDFLIGPTKEDPYMRRWWIIPRNEWFNIYLHHMRHDDDDRAAHDHPWWSLSLCLDGRIREYELLPKRAKLDAIMGKDKIVKHGDRWYRVNDIRTGQWKFRSKEYAHRLTLPDGDAWTLFITGPKVRKWGFHCPKGWVQWENFVKPESPGQPGRGCGEME